MEAGGIDTRHALRIRRSHGAEPQLRGSLPHAEAMHVETVALVRREQEPKFR